MKTRTSTKRCETTKKCAWRKRPRRERDPPRDCPLCPRLVAYREVWREREPGWHNAPVHDVRRDRSPAPDRRARARASRRQPHRPAVHRRLCRRPSLRDALEVRLRARRLSGRPRRRTDAGRLRDRQCGRLRAAARTSRRPAEINTCRPFLEAAISRAPAPSRRSSRSAASRMRRRCARCSEKPSKLRLRARRGARARKARASTTAIHCSGYNTNTGRLTTEMFEEVFENVRSETSDKRRPSAIRRALTPSPSRAAPSRAASRASSPSRACREASCPARARSRPSPCRGR